MVASVIYFTAVMTHLVQTTPIGPGDLALNTDQL